MQFTNKILLITGGATGIGAAIAKLFSSQGAKVYVLDIQQLSYQAENIKFIQCDVSDFAKIQMSVENILRAEGKIDFLIANAGIHLIADIETTSLQQIDQIIDVNIKGVIYTLKAVLPIMKKQRAGSIILMGSDQCFIGKSSSAIYGLTKGAIGQLAKSTAIDYAPYNIRVNCICPGTIDTPIADRAIGQLSKSHQSSPAEVRKMFENAQPIKRLGRPEEVANLTAFICSEHAAFMTGSLVSLDGGITAQ